MMSSNGAPYYQSNYVYRKRQPLGDVTNTYRVKNTASHSETKPSRPQLYFPHPYEISKFNFIPNQSAPTQHQDENNYK